MLSGGLSIACNSDDMTDGGPGGDSGGGIDASQNMDSTVDSRGSPEADASVPDASSDTASDAGAMEAHASLEGSADTGSITDALVDAGPDTITADSAVESGADAGDSSADAEGDAVVDGAIDAGNDVDASLDTAGVILATQGALCQACAIQMCVDAGTSCEHLAGGVADAGPASGQSRQQLCLDALSCILNTATACYNQGTPQACYCGVRSTQDCRDAGPAPGAACRTQEENGLETAMPTLALSRFYDTAFGAGTANALLVCIGNCGDCLQ
jgi:hypothetical protein